MWGRWGDFNQLCPVLYCVNLPIHHCYGQISYSSLTFEKRVKLIKWHISTRESKILSSAVICASQSFGETPEIILQRWVLYANKHRISKSMQKYKIIIFEEWYHKKYIFYFLFSHHTIKVAEIQKQSTCSSVPIPILPINYFKM